MNNNLKPVTTLPPFKRLCMTIGELPTSYLETMSYYEMLLWFTKYLGETVIPTINNNGLAVEELQAKYIELKSYVANYFSNLDVQEEINNKLDEMAEQGVFEEILTPYVTKHLTETVNVKSLGAKGDGETNDTTIIQEAIDENDVIYIPAGTYIIDTLTIPKDKILNGDGAGKTILSFTSLQNGVSVSDDSVSVNKVEFNNISFRSSFSENIIYLNNAYGVVFNNCEIYDTSNAKQLNGLVIDGADINPPADTPAYYNSFNNGRITSCNIGVKIINQANSNLINNVEIYSCNKGVYIDNSNGNKIIVNTIQDFLYDGIEINNTSELIYSNSNIIIGNYIEAKPSTNTVECGIKLDNTKVKTTQIISNKYSNLYSNSASEIIDSGLDTLRVDYTAVSPALEPITLPAFVRVNSKPVSYSTAYKNSKLFGCVQMFADDEASGKVMALNRIYDSDTHQYAYFWSELLGFNNSNKFDMTDKTIENGTLLNNNILQYYGKYVKLGSGDLPNVEGAIMYDTVLKRPKFSDGSTSRYLMYNAIGNTASRSNYQGYGFMMFDTTLGKPIWYDGTNWVDATGTQV